MGFPRRGGNRGTALPSKPPASAMRKASFYQLQHKFAQRTAPSGSCHRGVVSQSPRRAFAVMDVPVPAPSPAARGMLAGPLRHHGIPGAACWSRSRPRGAFPIPRLIFHGYNYLSHPPYRCRCKSHRVLNAEVQLSEQREGRVSGRTEPSINQLAAGPHSTQGGIIVLLLIQMAMRRFWVPAQQEAREAALAGRAGIFSEDSGCRSRAFERVGAS